MNKEDESFQQWEVRKLHFNLELAELYLHFVFSSTLGSALPGLFKILLFNLELSLNLQVNPLVLEDYASEGGEGWLDLIHGGHSSSLYK